MLYLRIFVIIIKNKKIDRRSDMFTILFTILTFIVFGKLLIFAVKASWGLARILVTVIFLPLVLIGLLVAGLVYLAVPFLLIAGVVSLVKTHN